MPTEEGEESRSAPRVPVKAQVKVQFADQGEFVNALAANVSLSGMFIRTQQPHPAGSFLDFELNLGGDFASAKGVGQVVWTRSDDEFAERPAGMGIRFRRIDQSSRNRGGDPFDLRDE